MILKDKRDVIMQKCISNLKSSRWFPFKTGNLKFHATHITRLDYDTYVITFSGVVAPYVEYLEEGTRPHNIPHAFGRPLPFGTSGRFDGMFHPGSDKHKGFISEKSINTIKETIKMESEK